MLKVSSAPPLHAHHALTMYAWYRLESAILDTLATVPGSVKTPDIGGTGGTKSLVKAITERL